MRDRLATAGVRAAVAARVTRAGSDHSPAALGALLGVLEGVEQSGLARRGRFDRRGRYRRRLAAVAVAVREPRSHLGGHDPELLLLLDRQEALAHPAEDVVDDRLRDADVGVVRHPTRLETHVRELR